METNQRSPLSSVCKKLVDAHVDAQGNLDHNLDSLDSMLPGNLLLLMYQETKEEKIQTCSGQDPAKFNDYPGLPTVASGTLPAPAASTSFA